MADQIRSALTAEEWATETAMDIVPLSTSLRWAASEVGRDGAVSILALAALALQHAGPDGGPLFAHEDVVVLGAMCGQWDGVMPEDGEYIRSATHTEHDRASSLAARLASLLPPRPRDPMSEKDDPITDDARARELVDAMERDLANGPQWVNDDGCPHANTITVVAFGGSTPKTFCSDCGLRLSIPGPGTP